MLLSLTYDTLKLERFGSNDGQSQNSKVSNASTPPTPASPSLSSNSRSSKKQSDKFYVLTLRMTFLFIITCVSGYLSLIISGAGIGEYWLCLDHVTNVICIYLSYSFNDKLYNKLCGCFAAKCCYKCCAPICFCCCQPKELPDHIQFAILYRQASRSSKGIDGSSTNQSTDTVVSSPTNV